MIFSGLRIWDFVSSFCDLLDGVHKADLEKNLQLDSAQKYFEVQLQ